MKIVKNYLVMSNTPNGDKNIKTFGNDSIGALRHFNSISVGWCPQLFIQVDPSMKKKAHVRKTWGTRGRVVSNTATNQIGMLMDNNIDNKGCIAIKLEDMVDQVLWPIDHCKLVEEIEEVRRFF